MSQEAYLIGGVRTPFGRYRGALAETRPDDLAALVVSRPPRPGRRPPRRGRRGRLRRRQPGRRGQPQRRADGRPARGPARRGPRVHRQPAVRLEPAGGRVRGAADPHRRGRRRRRRRRRVDDARAVGDGEARHGRGRVRARRSTRRSAGGSPTRACATSTAASDDQPRRDRRGGRACSTASRARSPTRSRCARTSAPRAAIDGASTRRARRGAAAGRRAHRATKARGRHHARAAREAQPASRPGGIVTAGNASPLSTTAPPRSWSRARRSVEQHGLTPRARVVATASAGVAAADHGPRPGAVDGEGRSTVPGWTVADLDAVEINEAFATQVIASIRRLGLDEDTVNADGGAIALGHPLGASGVRLVIGLLGRLEREGGTPRPRHAVRRRRPGHGDAGRDGLAPAAGESRRRSASPRRPWSSRCAGGRGARRSGRPCAQLAALGEAGRVRAELLHPGAPVAAVPDDLLDAHAARERLRLTEAVRGEQHGDQARGPRRSAGTSTSRCQSTARPSACSEASCGPTSRSGRCPR